MMVSYLLQIRKVCLSSFWFFCFIGWLVGWDRASTTAQATVESVPVLLAPSSGARVQLQLYPACHSLHVLITWGCFRAVSSAPPFFLTCSEGGRRRFLFFPFYLHTTVTNCFCLDIYIKSLLISNLISWFYSAKLGFLRRCNFKSVKNGKQIFLWQRA